MVKMEFSCLYSFVFFSLYFVFFGNLFVVFAQPFPRNNLSIQFDLEFNVCVWFSQRVTLNSNDRGDTFNWGGTCSAWRSLRSDIHTVPDRKVMVLSLAYLRHFFGLNRIHEWDSHRANQIDSIHRLPSLSMPSRIPLWIITILRNRLFEMNKPSLTDSIHQPIDYSLSNSFIGGRLRFSFSRSFLCLFAWAFHFFRLIRYTLRSQSRIFTNSRSASSLTWFDIFVLNLFLDSSQWSLWVKRLMVHWNR